MKVRQLCGEEGGTQRLIITVFGKPWGVYASFKPRHDKRLRVQLGPEFNRAQVSWGTFRDSTPRTLVLRDSVKAA